MAARPTTLFGQIRNGVISNNQQRTFNRMMRARTNPGTRTHRQMFRFTRNLSPTRKRKSRSRSHSRSSKRRKSSH
jgi:hypothetical protein